MDSNPPLSSTYKTLLAKHPQQLRPGRITAPECDLPIIDLQNLTSKNAEIVKKCKREIVSAASEWGFFQAINHGISHDLLLQLRKFQVNLFHEPFEKKKMENLLQLAPENYCWGTPSATRLEQFSWSEAYHFPLSSLRGSNEDSKREIIQDISKGMSRVAHQMASILGRELGDMNGNYIKKNCTSNTCYLRLNHYPPCPEPSGAFGLVPHTDSDFLTVLYQDQVGGLQLMKEGRWVNVKPNSSALIINIGDLFQIILLEGSERYKAIEEMLRNMLACCKLYISESQNTQALHLMESSLKKHPKTQIVNRFTDDVYNRVGYTLVSTLIPNKIDTGVVSPLMEAAFDMLKSAYEFIDLGLHCGSHPRLGVVDHVCFHPLRDATLDHVATLARSVAARVGEELAVPTYLYGAAHTSGQTLASIRRQLGYFKPNADQNQWAGSLSPNILNIKPDFGPTNPVQNSKGVLTLGATKWVDNYNVPVHCTDIELVKRIARRVSERGGGLESVQAMGLAHKDGVMEVACNLLDPGRIGSKRVQAEVERLGREEGLTVRKGYFTDFSEEKIVELYLESIESM